MKKCTYCGREYPDDLTVCPQDQQPLAPISPPPLPGNPVAAQVQGLPSKGMAIGSLVMGIFSVILCGPFLGIPAVVCGHIALNRSQRSPTQYGGGGMAIGGLVTGYFGSTVMCLAIMAGLLLPALAKAKQKAQQINCASNLKQIGLAERIWAGDHNGLLPENFMELTNELGNPKVLICPADPNHHILSDGSPLVWSSDNVSYQFLLPGTDAARDAGQVIVRCPIHGTELYGDGSVHLVNPNRARSSSN